MEKVSSCSQERIQGVTVAPLGVEDSGLLEQNDRRVSRLHGKGRGQKERKQKMHVRAPRCLPGDT
jgi:hypothetical protein